MTLVLLRLHVFFGETISGICGMFHAIIGNLVGVASSIIIILSIELRLMVYIGILMLMFALILQISMNTLFRVHRSFVRLKADIECGSLSVRNLVWKPIVSAMQSLRTACTGLVWMKKCVPLMSLTMDGIARWFVIQKFLRIKESFLCYIMVITTVKQASVLPSWKMRNTVYQ